MVKKAVYIECKDDGWLRDMFQAVIDDQGEDCEFEIVTKITGANILLSDQPKLFRQHLRGTWKGEVAILITDTPSSTAKKHGGKSYIEISQNALAFSFFMLTLGLHSPKKKKK